MQDIFRVIAVYHLLFVLRLTGSFHHQEWGTDKCPIPAELLGLTHFPTLHTGPYAKNPWRLRPEFTVDITDDEGETYTNLFGPTSPVAFFAVRDSRLFQLGGNASPTTDVFNRFTGALAHALNHRISLPSGDFCFDATDNDAFVLNYLNHAELYCASQITWFPAPYPIIAVPSIFYERSLMHDHMIAVPWDQKVPKIYWRGSLTGTPGMYTGGSKDPFMNLPRVVAYQVAQRHSEMFDFGFTHIDNQLTERYMGGDTNKEQASLIDGIRFSKNDDFQTSLPRFKYLLNVDGIVVAWRLRELLMSGSVVFHFMGTSAEFFFRDLKPWEHYVPVHDLHSLPELYRKLDADPVLARRIAAAGKAFAGKRLTVDGEDCYLSHFVQFISNRTRYELADVEALKAMGFFEIHATKRKKMNRQLIRKQTAWLHSDGSIALGKIG